MAYQRERIMREKLNRFMQGRYGTDQLGKFTMTIALVFIVLTIVMPHGSGLRRIFDFLGLAAVVYSYFRMMSRNISARYAENQRYLSRTEDVRRWIGKEQYRMQQRKVYHFYRCPNCQQKIRIPRGKGKIEIDCPKCHTKFVKKS